MTKDIMLILWLMTPPGQPDISHRQPFATLEQCYQAAAEFTATDITDVMRQHGIIGKAATCAAAEKPSRDIQN